jgi:hypothetical protein
VAGSLGYALSVKNLYVMNIEYYTGVGTRPRRPGHAAPVSEPDGAGRSSHPHRR